VLVVRNWDRIRDAVARVFARVREIIQNVVGRIREIFGAVVAWIQERIDAIRERFQAFRDTVVGVFERIRETVSGVFQAIRDWFYERIIEPIQRGVERIRGMFERLNPRNWFRGRATVEGDVQYNDGGYTPMAKGGLLSGPTRILGGEYPGARRNPEVVSPLNKLRGLMVGDFAKALSDVQKMWAPSSKLAMAGANYHTVNQYNTFEQSFTCSDRDVQKKTDKAMSNSTKDATSELARALRNQR
jgi:hypothetical protein